MSAVKRLDIIYEWDSSSVGEVPDGDYVLYSDYEADTSALLTRIASLEREKEEAKADRKMLVLMAYRNEEISIGKACELLRPELEADGRGIDTLIAEHVAEFGKSRIEELQAEIDVVRKSSLDLNLDVSRQLSEARDKALEEAADAIDPKAVGTTAANTIRAMKGTKP